MTRHRYGSPGLLPAIVLAGALAAGAAAPSGAQVATRHVPGSLGIPQPEPKVTLSIKQRSLNRILAEMRKQVPYEFRTLADIGVTVFSLDVKQVPVSTALNVLLEQDKNVEPLVFSFTKATNSNGGYFTIQRELIDLAPVDGVHRISVANARITRVLPEIFKQMQVKYRIEPDVPPILISLQLRPETWAQAFQQAMLLGYQQEPGLTYSLEGDTYVVHLHKTPLGLTPAGAVSADTRRVTLAVTQLPLKDTLAELFKGSQWKYQVSDDVKDVRISYTTQGEPELVALQSVLRKAGLNGQQVTYREGRGVLYIEPGALPGEFIISKSSPAVRRTVTLAFTDAPIFDVIRYVETNTGSTIKIAPNVPNNVRISIKGERLTAEDALKTLVEAGRTSLPSLNYKKAAGDNQFVVDLSGGK
jgi:hypothetical protein